MLFGFVAILNFFLSIFCLENHPNPSFSTLLGATCFQKAQGNFDAALEVLLSGGGEDEPPPPPKSTPVAAKASPAKAPPVPSGGDDEIPEHFLCAITCVSILFF
jgi:hypothetical protein